MKAVIFDIGGVLAHDVWEPLLYEAPNSIALEFSLDKEVVKKVGRLLWEAFAYRPEMLHNDSQALERQYWCLFIEFFREKLGTHIDVDIFIGKSLEFIKPVEQADMTALLERLRSKKVQLAICSNNNEFWFRHQWDEVGLERFFGPENVILSCRVGVSKSSHNFEMFDAAANVMKVAKSDCVFVDDRCKNVKRAQECGMVGLLFTHARSLSNALEAMGL